MRKIYSKRSTQVGFPRTSVLLGEDQGSKVFGNMIGVALDDAGRLPAHEMTLRIFTEAIDAVEVAAPFRARLYGLIADGLQRDARRGVPHVICLINPSESLKSGVPAGVVFLVIEINGQVDPVAGRGNLELTVVVDVCPIVAQKELNHVTVPELEAIFAGIRGEPEIQLVIRRDEQEIQIGVGPEGAHLSLEFGIIELLRAILHDPCGRCTRPRFRVRIGIKFRRLLNVWYENGGHWRSNLAHLNCERQDWSQKNQEHVSDCFHCFMGGAHFLTPAKSRRPARTPGAGMYSCGAALSRIESV